MVYTKVKTLYQINEHDLVIMGKYEFEKNGREFPDFEFFIKRNL